MAEFKPAIDFAMKHEDATLSGRVTVDSGGRTRFGIAQRFHPDLPESFFTGDKYTALGIAENLLQSEYWRRLLLNELNNQAVATKIFDMAVDMGAHQAAIYAQRAAALKEDGIIGPKTIAALNSALPGVLLERLVKISRTHYMTTAARHPQDARMLEGWLKRADDLPAEQLSPAARGARA